MSFEQIEKVEFPEVRFGLAWLGLAWLLRSVPVARLFVPEVVLSIYTYISGIIRTRNGIIHTHIYILVALSVPEMVLSIYMYILVALSVP